MSLDSRVTYQMQSGAYHGMMGSKSLVPITGGRTRINLLEYFTQLELMTEIAWDDE